MLTQQNSGSWRLAPLWIGCALASAIAIASCDKMPLVAPTGSTLTLIATNNVVPVDGAVEIIAIVTEGTLSGGEDNGVTAGGTPVHNGTVVTFTTTIGRIEPAEALTKSGRATARLIGDGRSGTALVTAFSGSATQSLEILVGAAAADFVAVTASPQSLSGTGGSSTITARVEDFDGNVLPNVPVTFTTTAGTLTVTNATTNASGIATTVLSTTQEAIVTATAGFASGEVTVLIKPRITVTIAPPLQATVGVPATFTITPAEDSIVTDVVVDFGDGGDVSLGAITSATQVVHLFKSAGVKSVTATAYDSDGAQSTSATQVAVGPLELNLSLSSASVQRGTQVVFTATPTPGALISRYVWNFGDGDTVETSGNQALKVYPTAGTRAVSVTAYPTGGGTPATAVSSITVVN